MSRRLFSLLFVVACIASVTLSYSLAPMSLGRRNKDVSYYELVNMMQARFDQNHRFDQNQRAANGGAPLDYLSMKAILDDYLRSIEERSSPKLMGFF